jgi:hypothetical protein
MGAVLENCDFQAIILGSLPESYRPLLLSINAASQIAQKPLTPNGLISVVSEEYEHQQIMDRHTKKKGSLSVFSAKTTHKKGKSQMSKSEANADATCFNCERKGHYKADCWRPGGDKEGQGPKQKARQGGRGQKHSANAASNDQPDP